MKSLKYQQPSQPIEYNFDPSRIKEIPEWEWDKWARHGAVDWTPYSSISDYRAKEITGTEGWSESLQHYTPTQYIRTGNPTSGFKYYSVPQFTPKGYTYSPSTTQSTQTAVSTSTPQQPAPTQSKTIGETIIDTGKQAVETVKQAGESIASTGKKAVKKVLGWFGFKQGGTITYFDYFY